MFKKYIIRNCILFCWNNFFLLLLLIWIFTGKWIWSRRANVNRNSPCTERLNSISITIFPNTIRRTRTLPEFGVTTQHSCTTWDNVTMVVFPLKIPHDTSSIATIAVVTLYPVSRTTCHRWGLTRTMGSYRGTTRSIAGNYRNRVGRAPGIGRFVRKRPS